ncbi:MAG: substrate-binding domain-containing protein [Ostreibacterium sp.]
MKLILLSVTVSTIMLGIASAKDTGACLITKTDINPFFVKMKEGAMQEAMKSHISLSTFAGKVDGDVEAQMAAIESCIAFGAKGIIITPSDSKALVPLVRQARKAGILVIALDTPFEPADAADATFATDNFKAGVLIGQWAAAKLGDAAKKAKIAMLDLSASGVSIDYLRDNGFLKGFGIDIKDPTKIGDEIDSRIIGHGVTNGNEEGGRTAMENLLQINPDINVVYTVNEPAAAGAYEALKAVGRDKKVLLVSIDGGCSGVKNVQEKVIGATAMQFPLLMAKKGMQAIRDWVEKGIKPAKKNGLNFFDTGVQLITNDPVKGVPSINAKSGLDKCWG